MDMQGTPIGSTSQGMKNTTDPAAKNPTTEGAGPVASDSLAAESVNAGGAFSENRSSNPLSVSGSNSTFNNTDISGATTLAPAPDAAEREAKAAWQENSDEIKGPGGVKYSEGAGVPKFPGAHNADGYSGGSTAAKQETKASEISSSAAKPGTRESGSSSSTGGAPDISDSSGDASGSTGNTGSSSETYKDSSVDSAPSYISSATASAADGKPKGKNITEGGFDSNPENNASFTSDIGTEDDPGRAAELQFQKQNTVNVGTGPKQGGATGTGPAAGQYDTLESDQNL